MFPFPPGPRYRSFRRRCRSFRRYAAIDATSRTRTGETLPAVALVSAMRKEVRPHSELAALAARQHGVVSQRQLRELGYSEGAIARAVRGGRLHRLHRGAYGVGHPAVSQQGMYLAAVLSCGRGALISHFSAAWLWGLHPRWIRVPEVTAPFRGHRRAGIRIHHSTILEAADRAVLEGIPVTAVPRVLLDLGARQTDKQLESLLERGELSGLLDVGAIDSLIARSGRHAGRKRLQRAIRLYRSPIMSRARTERVFFDLVKRSGLPKPAINTFVAGHEIDAYWERERFAVELDGFATHRTRAAFERDPVRIEDLKLAGIDAIRVTARRLEREPDEVIKRLGTLLAQRRQALRPR
jgi:very-short-patch-repair endonuclease